MKARPKVLILDKMHPSITNMLAEIGLEAVVKLDLNRTQILEQIAHYQGVIVRGKTTIDKELMEKATQLKFVARAGSGLEIIDRQYAQSRNIIVVNAPEGNRDAVAEHTVGMLLVLMHNLRQADQQVRQYIWDREGNRGIELKGKTFAIIGYGNTGHQVAKRLSGFGCKVLAYDKYDSNYSNEFAQEATMEQIFAESDVVSLHIPLTDETRNMVDEIYFDSFKKPIFLINTSRGEIVRLEALRQALEQGKVLGACLDVLENEKITQLTPAQKNVFEALIKNPKVLLSPHVAGWTKESYLRINEVLINKLKHALQQSVKNIN